MVTPTSNCTHCGISRSSKTPRLSCSGCQKVEYCGKECQKSAWKTHRHVCDKFLKNPKSVPNGALTPCGLTARHILVLEKRSDELVNLEPHILKDAFGGTAEDLEKLVAPPPASDQPVCMAKLNGDVQKISQAQFRQLSGGLTYSQEHVVTSTKDFLEVRNLELTTDTNPRDGFQILSPSNTEDLAKLRQFEKAPPTVYVQKNEAFGGLELVSGQKIKSGQIICHFGGAISLTKRTYQESLGRIEEFDPTKISGLGALVNDGFPNAIFTTVLNYHGMSKTMYLTATRDLELGEIVLTSYGSEHPVKTGIHTIERGSLQRARDFCKSFSFTDLNENFFSEIRKPGNRQKLLQIISIFETPNLFIRLHLEGVLKPERTLAFMKTRLFQGLFVDAAQPPLAIFYPKILNTIQAILHRNPSVVNPLIALQKSISARACVEILSQMDIEDCLPIEDYETLGKLSDKLYIYINGTLTGTKIGRPEKDTESKDEAVDLKEIKLPFSKLPKPLKKELLLTLDSVICISQEKCQNKLESLLTLKMSLES